MRIMTGAALPSGADAVVPVEDTDSAIAQPGVALPAQVQVKRVVKTGDFVRPAGEDFKAGDLLMDAGTRVRAQEAALLAMLGRSSISVHKKPRVAILSSGDELLAPDEPMAPGKIRETNSTSLAALVESCWAETVLLGIARDNLQDVINHLDNGVKAGADLIISSAGVSVGAYDYLREAIIANGDLDFWRVNMRPGKPFAFGSYREIPYVGLPGNPVSSFVGFEVFLRPALQAMGGAKYWSRISLMARAMDPTTSDGRESYLRVKLKSDEDGLAAYLTGHQGSGNLYSLVQANALMRVPAGVTELSVGSQVEVWPL
jgi:molybdopterin molybdotransferase